MINWPSYVRKSSKRHRNKLDRPHGTSAVAKGNYPEGTNKCNLFVYEMLTGAGASPGTPHGRWPGHTIRPRAGEWADPNYAIPGWRVLGPDKPPQPGDVVAQPKDYPNGATGHVMIVGPNNTFIGVGESRTSRSKDPERIEIVPKKDIIVSPLLKVRCCIDVLLGDNMRRFILHVVLCLGCAFAPCLNVASAASNGSETSSPLDEDRYQAYVEKIAKALRDTAVNKTLEYPLIKSFQELAVAGAANIDLCVRFLSEREHADNGFVIYSMYKLDVDGYDVFVRKLVELHHRGLLSDVGLSMGVRPRFSDLVIEQYQNPKIKALLKEMAAREDIPPDVKDDIRYIRSGEGFARKRWDDFDRECKRWSQMRSIAACVSLATQILTVSAVSLTW